MGQAPRLVTVGSILVDIRLEVPHLPARGGDVIGRRAAVSTGGGFNILAAAARQGMACVFAGRHGTGPHGSRIRADLAAEAIAVLHPPATEGDSGFCLAMVEPDGERSFVSSPGVEAALGGRRLRDLDLAPGDWVFVSGYDLAYSEIGPAVAAWIGSLPRSVQVAIDPGPLAAEIPASVMALAMPRATLWSMNRREAALLAGPADLAALRARLAPGLARDALLVLRDGAEGAWLSPGAGAAFFHVPSPDVRAVDTTGAGDAHAGVMIAALAAGLSPVDAVARANAAAALSVTRAGPATAPGRDALDRFLAGTDARSRRRVAEAD